MEERAHAIVPRTSLEALAGAGLRIGLGLVVLARGWQKAIEFGAWEHHVAMLGLPFPEALARLALVLELGGGALMVLGMLTPVAGTMIAVVMAAAIATTRVGSFSDVGWELPALLALGGLFFAAYGSGPFGVDTVLARRNREEANARRRYVARPVLAESRF